jgi:hypothetical protein
VDKFAEITGHIEGCGTGIGENVSRILVGHSTILITFVERLYCRHINHEINGIERSWLNVIEPIFRTVSLTSLRKGAMSVSYQLMRASAGDTLDFEREVDVFKY